MKPDEYEQFNNPLNYPAPLFLTVGPGHVRVRDADEMASYLEEIGPEGYIQAKNMTIYIKLPFEESLVKVTVNFADHDDHWLYEFIDVESGEFVMMPGGNLFRVTLTS